MPRSELGYRTSAVIQSVVDSEKIASQIKLTKACFERDGEHARAADSSSARVWLAQRRRRLPASDGNQAAHTAERPFIGIRIALAKPQTRPAHRCA
jgi:hypothetical protein